jgi:hypothetical protein
MVKAFAESCQRPSFKARVLHDNSTLDHTQVTCMPAISMYPSSYLSAHAPMTGILCLPIRVVDFAVLWWSPSSS